MEPQFVEPSPHVQAFVLQLLNDGGMLARVVDALVDALVTNGSSEEEATGDVAVTLMGTVATRLTSFGEADFTRATQLLEQAAEAVLADLRLAERDIRRRGRGESRGPRRGHAARRRAA